MVMLWPEHSWLQQQPEFQHIKGLLSGLPPPSVMDAHIAALTSPLLRLRVVQLKLWKVGHMFCIMLCLHQAWRPVRQMCVSCMLSLASLCCSILQYGC